MASNPLKDLLKKDPREIPSYNPGVEGVQPYAQRGGSYGTPVQPTATNKTLKFVDDFNKAIAGTSKLVDVTQQQAAIKVAEMDDNEFNKAYNDLIGGDKEVSNLFGYNKAFQEKMVERVYRDVVPMEVKELKSAFATRIQDFNDITEFDAASEQVVDDYFEKLSGRFNNNPFAQTAHTLLQQGTKNKIKLELHDGYIKQAREYIAASEADSFTRGLDSIEGDYENIGAVLTSHHQVASANLGGDNAAANNMARGAVKGKIQALIATGNLSAIEDAEDLFDSVFMDDPLMVNGKDIFEGIEGQAMERELRVSLRNARITAPQIMQSKVEARNAGWVIQVKDKVGAERQQDEKKIEEEIARIEDPQEHLAALELWNKSKDSDILDVDNAINKEREKLRRMNRDPHVFSDKATVRVLDSLSLTSEQRNHFVTLGEDQVTVVLKPEVANLTAFYQTEYSKNLRERENAIIESNVDDATKLNQLGDARLQAMEYATNQVSDRIRDISKAEEPKQMANENIARARKAGVPEIVIKQSEALINNGEFEQGEELLTKETDRLNQQKFSDMADGEQLKIGFFTDGTEASQNFITLTQGGFYGDDVERYSKDYTRVVTHMAKDKKMFGRLAQVYEDGQKITALQELYNTYSVVGFTADEIKQGYVTHSYTDQISVGTGGTVPVKRALKIPISDIMLFNVDGAGNVVLDDWSRVPVRLTNQYDPNGDMQLLFDGADTAAIEQIAKKLEIDPQAFIEQQKSYYTTAGLVDEKKTDEVAPLAPTIRGDLPDLEDDEGGLESFKSFYEVNEGDKLNYKDFAFKYYKENLPPNITDEEIRKDIDEKFKAMESRNPELFKMVSKPTPVSFQMPQKYEDLNYAGYYLNGKIVVDGRMGMENIANTLMHELVHSAQMGNKLTLGSRLAENIYTGELKDRVTDTVKPADDLVAYLRTEKEAEARMAEVARYHAEKYGRLLRSNNKSDGRSALMLFLTDDGLPRKYQGTRNEIFKILGIGRGATPEELEQDLKKIKNIDKIYESISTLATKDKPFNSKQQLA
jgi:5'(3')-deoxyribonucleotidase